VTLRIVEFQACLGGQPLSRDLAGRRKQVRMKVSRVAAGEIARCVDRQIESESIPLDEFSGKAANQLETLSRIEFDRKGHEILSRDAGIDAGFGAFGSIPKLRPVSRPAHVRIAEASRQNDFRVQDSRATPVIVRPAGTVIVYSLAGPIRGGTDRAASAGSAERLEIQIIDGHTRLTRDPWR
jgi:hypothetical protein